MKFPIHKYPRFLLMRYSFLHSQLKRKAASVIANNNSSKKFFRILFKNLNSSNEDLAKLSLAFFMQLMYSHKKVFDIFQRCFKIFKKDMVLLNPSLLATENDIQVVVAVKKAYNDFNHLDSLFLNIDLESKKMKLKCMSLPLSYNPQEQSYLNYFDSPEKNLIFLNLKATQKYPKIEIKKKISIPKEAEDNVQKVDFSNIQQKTYLNPQSSKTIKITSSCQKKNRSNSKTFFNPENIKPMKQKTLFKKKLIREKSLNIYNSYQSKAKDLQSSRDKSRLSAQIIKKHLGASREKYTFKAYVQNTNTKTKKKLSTSKSQMKNNHNKSFKKTETFQSRLKNRNGSNDIFFPKSIKKNLGAKLKQQIKSNFSLYSLKKNKVSQLNQNILQYLIPLFYIIFLLFSQKKMKRIILRYIF